MSQTCEKKVTKGGKLVREKSDKLVKESHKLVKKSNKPVKKNYKLVEKVTKSEKLVRNQ